MKGKKFVYQGNETNLKETEVTFPSKDNIGTDYNYKHEVIWKNAIGLLIFHILASYGFVLLFTGRYKFYTFVWNIFLIEIGSMAITIGTHRYYCHRSFKAKPLLRALFLIGQTMTGQNSMYIWCRDHRLHHRYSDTDADPHNATRGFFFSHVGWLMTKKHPLVKQLGKNTNMSDLKADWMVMFQYKYYFPLYLLIGMLLPIAVPVYYFGESWKNAIFICYFARNAYQLNGTWLINSAGHLYGPRPYDAKLQPVECWFASLITSGEGWHNYHHAFPWDYKAAELTMHLNFNAQAIRFFERIGLAWDLKTASLELVKQRILRTGDGSHYQLGEAARKAATEMRPVHLFTINPTHTTLLNDLETVEPEGRPLYHENDASHYLKE